MSETLAFGTIIIFVMLTFFMTSGALIEKYHLTFGHEASYTVLMGMLISYLTMANGANKIEGMLEFDDKLFFFLCLPPIVFASGFNMQRGDFFGNLSNIMLFGVLGTFVAFFSFSALTIFIKGKMDLFMYKHNTTTNEFDKLEMKLSDTEVMLFCSLMCSSDVVAAVSLISYDA